MVLEKTKTKFFKTIRKNFNSDIFSLETEKSKQIIFTNRN